MAANVAIAIALAKGAGEILLDRPADLQVQTKSTATDVVTEMDDQVAASRDHVAVGVEVPLLVVLATRDADSQNRLHRAARMSCPGSPDGAHMIAGAKPVVELASGWQAADFEMHAVTVGCHRNHRSRLHST
mgnify:CR=1 FL=1